MSEEEFDSVFGRKHRKADAARRRPLCTLFDKSHKFQVLGVSCALQAVGEVARLVMAEYENFLQRERDEQGRS